DLDALLDAGEWVWVGSGNDPKRMRVRFFKRGEGALFLEAANTTDLSGEAQNAHEFLKSEGASFATDILAGTRLASDTLASALSELTLRGLVTNDSYETLRNLLEHGAIVRAVMGGATNRA